MCGGHGLWHLGHPTGHPQPHNTQQEVPGAPGAPADPLQVLKLRLARGEITPEQYRQLLALLNEAPR